MSALPNLCVSDNHTNTTAYEQKLIASVVRLIESLLIIIGNVIVIAVFIRTRQLRKRKFCLLINLAIADCLVGSIELPRRIAKLGEISDMWGHTWASWIQKFLFNFATFASLINLMLVSVERLYATLWPFKHRVLSKKVYVVFVVLSWSLAISLLVLYIVSSCFGSMWFNNTASAYFLFIGLSLLIICINCIIIWVKFKFGERPSCNVNSALDRKLTSSLLIVIVVALATCVPHLCLKVAIDIFHESPDTDIHSVFDLLLLANSLANPIIYSFRMPQFRRAALRLICRRSAERHAHPIEMRNRAEAENL